MKEFRGKLRRAFKIDADEPHVSRDAAPYGRCADVLRRHHERSRRGLPEVELPEGREIVDGSGRYWVRRLEYAITDVHGAHALDAPHRADWERIAELAKLPELAAGPGDCLFLDTETTGLSGGAGTVVFLCGLGFFEGDVLVLEQVFLRAFAEEPAALAHVARRMVEHPALVTFVGKSFDRHRLAARMTLHKIDSSVLTDRHLDLYYMARRAWGKDLPDVRLRTVEEWKLGLRRVDDMPGAEAPYAFLSWLRDRTGRVDRVFEHNRLDVLSLVTLLGVLGEQ